jgi:hypothetical protein
MLPTAQPCVPVSAPVAPVAYPYVCPKSDQHSGPRCVLTCPCRVYLGLLLQEEPLAIS